MSTEILRLGTRKALLARAQCGHVAQKLIRMHPGIRIELVTLETRGDSAEKPSLAIPEMDDALLKGKVDFNVHSFKDLPLERPDGICCAATPDRLDPRDIIVFSPDILLRLRANKIIRLGSSSARRQHMLGEFLRRALPQSGEILPQIEWIELQGNIPLRLKRLTESEASGKKVDGIVLALAGLIRLWEDPQTRPEMEPLLKTAHLMICPISECPSAPGQGALAVECLKTNGKVIQILKKIHKEKVLRSVQREREVLSRFSPDCHLKIGATCIEHPRLKELFWIRGESKPGENISEFHWGSRPAALQGNPRFFNGTLLKNQVLIREGALRELDPPKSRALFITHWNALTPEFEKQLCENSTRIYVSGKSSWFKLAQKGIWVDGCAESLGFDWLSPLFEEKVLRLPEFPSGWTVLTHEEAKDCWSEAPVIATYQSKEAEDLAPEALNRLKESDVIFWNSGAQFRRLNSHVAAGVLHCCAPGKTAQQIESAGMKVLIFPGVEEWKKWIQNHQEKGS